MINAIIKGIFSLITSLINVVLAPINALITAGIPELSNIFGTIRNLFTLLFQYSGWVLDACLISAETISLLIALFTLRYTIPLTINTIKLAVKWYNALKP